MPYEVLDKKYNRGAAHVFLLPISLASLAYLLYMLSWTGRSIFIAWLVIMFVAEVVIKEKPIKNLRNASLLMMIPAIIFTVYCFMVEISLYEILRIGLTGGVFFLTSIFMGRYAYGFF